MLTYRKKHLCMSLKSQLCEVENRCRCFPTTLTTAPLLSSALSHCHRAACVSLHFLTLCCAVFRAITFSCIKQNMIHLHIYISQTAKLSAALISGLRLTALYAYCTGMPAVILHELVSLFFFFKWEMYQFGIGDLISLLSCISSGSDVSAESDHFKSV